MATRIPDVERALWDAVEQRTLELHYQPIVNLHDATLGAAEALLRWRRDSAVVSRGERSSRDVLDPELVVRDLGVHVRGGGAPGGDLAAALPELDLPGHGERGDRRVHRRARRPRRRAPRAPRAPVRRARRRRVGAACSSTTATRSRARVAALKAAGAQVFVDDFGTTHADRRSDASTVTRSTDELLTSVVALESLADRRPEGRPRARRPLLRRRARRPGHPGDREGGAPRRASGSSPKASRRATRPRRSDDRGFDLAQGYYFQRPHGPGHIDRLLHDLADARQAFAATPHPLSATAASRVAGAAGAVAWVRFGHGRSGPVRRARDAVHVAALLGCIADDAQPLRRGGPRAGDVPPRVPRVRWLPGGHEPQGLALQDPHQHVHQLVPVEEASPRRGRARHHRGLLPLPPPGRPRGRQRGQDARSRRCSTPCPTPS